MAPNSSISISCRPSRHPLGYDSVLGSVKRMKICILKTKAELDIYG
jgi:hypothetical protein